MIPKNFLIIRSCEYGGLHLEKGKFLTFLDCLMHLHETMITELVASGYLYPID